MNCTETTWMHAHVTHVRGSSREISIILLSAGLGFLTVSSVGRKNYNSA